MLSYSFGTHLERPPYGTSSPRVCELQKSNLLVWRLVLNSLTFFKSPQTSARFWCVTSLAPRHAFRLGLLWHLHPPARARVNTCLNVCTELNHVLSRKVLSLTKLKGMDRNPLAITLHNVLFWTNTGSRTAQNNRSTVTCLSSYKQFK